MNVLVVMPLGEFGGGAEQMLYHYLATRTLQGGPHLFLLFLSPGRLADSARALGYPTCVLPAGRVREIHRLISLQHKIGQIMKRWQIDRVLAWMPKACAYVALPARLRQTPLFIWRHDIPNSLDKLDRWVLRYGNPISIACSSEVANQALQRCADGSFTTRAIHPGVEPRSADLENARSIRDWILGGQDGFIVGTVTRLQPWKRVDLFLRSVAQLRSRGHNLKALIVGGESHGLSQGHAEELRSLGRDLLRDDAIFVGEQRNVGDWLNAMDVFVLASDGEPFGIALVEALAAGKPVVACAGGGPEEIVTQEAVGVLLPKTPTPVQMGEAVLRLLDPATLQAASRDNPHHAARFSPAAMAQNIDHWLCFAR